MNLTAAVISAGTGAPLARASDWMSALQTACDRFQINTSLRVAAFLAQVGHESIGLARTAESFDYSVAALPQVFRRITPTLAETLGRQAGERMVPLERQQRIANIAYAGQYGNGDSGSGDGWTFRGAGLIQLTFRSNFEACGADLSLNLVGEPDRVRADPALAALVSAWFWSSRSLNVLADAGNFLGITKRINPALLGSSHRNQLYAAAKAALGIAA
jgi:putative chitinase